MKKIKIIFFCLMLCIISNIPSNSYAFFGLFGDSDSKEIKVPNLSQCDYDETLYGSGKITVAKDIYSFNFTAEEIGDEYVFVGSVNEPLFAQIQNALSKAKTNEFGAKDIVLFMSMNKPICASAFERASLYIQPGIIEKNDAYIVGVCIPETSGCWKMKINKGGIITLSRRFEEKW